MKYILLALVMCLSACGFQPVYAPSAGAAGHSGYITVEPIRGRSGHILRKALQQELAIGLPNVTQSARLSVTLNEQLTRLAFKPDGAASRSSVIANARYALAKNSGAVNGRVNVEASFNVPDAPYADIAAQTGASDRAMRMLAKRIVDDLRIQLSAG